MTLTVTGQLLTDILTALTSLCSKTDIMVSDLDTIKSGVSYSGVGLYAVVSSMASELTAFKGEVHSTISESGTATVHTGAR